MAQDDGIVIKITGDSKDFEKAAKQLKEIFDGIGKDAEKSSGLASNAFASFLGNLGANAVSSAFAAIKDGFKELVSQIGESIKAANEQEDAINSLNRALASSGQFSEAASKDMVKFAGDMQKVSLVGDEVIVKNAALIQSLGQLDKDGLQRATKAALDLSAAIGVDLATASNIVGKAAQGNVEVLKKYGIQVEDTGDKTKDFATALSKIEGKFGGAAEAATKTFSGALTQTKNVLSDLQEELGGVITSTPGLRGAIAGVGDVFTLFIKIIQDNKGAIQDFIEKGVNIFIDAIDLAGKSLQFFLDLKVGVEAFFTILNNAFLSLIGLSADFNEKISTATVAVKEFFGLNAEGSKAAAEGFKEISAATEAAKQANLDELQVSIEANEARKESIQSFTDQAKLLVQDRVDTARAAGEQENVDFLNNLNAKSQIAQEKSAEQLAFEQEFNAQLLQDVRDNLGKTEAAEFESQTKKLANEGKFTEALRKVRAEQQKIEENKIFAIRKYEDLTNKERLANLQSSLGSIATLQASSSKELFAIGKGAAIATATIDGIQAVQKALASAPPPFNFALAALVGTAQALNISKIAGASPPTGAANGAFVSGGAGATVDDQPFMLARGELVAPARSFDEVVEGTARQRGFVPGDENEKTNSLLEQILAKVGVGGIVIQGDFLADEIFINKLVDKIRDAVEFRGAELGV